MSKLILTFGFALLKVNLMENTIQIVLVISIGCLTTVFVVVGVWLILVLKEVREAIKRVNQTVYHLTSFIEKLNDPKELVPGILEGVKSGLEIIKLTRGFFIKDDKPKRKAPK